MSNQFRYLMTGDQVVSTLMRAHPADEAMARAVGGDFEKFGVLEHALLREFGLSPEASLVDVGCGSGRLATQLARHPALRYLGTDVVPALLEYARQRTGRADFRFIHVDRVNIPGGDASADFVAFFSVLTHLLHEESFLYLREAHRVLKPGGKAVFSFLEYDTPVGWTVFEANLNWVQSRVVASQLNIFLHRSDIRLWARRLGFVVEELRAGDLGSVTVGETEATASVPAGKHAFGQSIAVLRKPGPEEDVPADQKKVARRAKRNRPAREGGGEGRGSAARAGRGGRGGTAAG
jgi:ubiquinone/menaquinone biosynthesis C-methylase UbiE